jgi:UDPglucose 6-dehydrogenase
MKIMIIGAGYVGLTAAVCFAEMGNDVICVEQNKNKYTLLKNGRLPIFEPYLESLFKKNIDENRLHFLLNIDGLQSDIDIIFICVGTPSRDNGECNTDYVFDAVGQVISHLSFPCIIATKSTVPVGTGDIIQKMILSNVTLDLQNDIHVVSNPEFMKEGVAIDDFMHPDRVILGVESDKVKPKLLQLYSTFFRKTHRILFMPRRDAEMVKYVSNAMLANRVSFMNEIALICDQSGADIDHVRAGVGSDPRIGSDFLYAGCGFGGSCFPKDVNALIDIANKNEINPLILKAIIDRNTYQKGYLFKKIKQYFKNKVSGLTFAVWGLSFKPKTDDVRDSPSKVMIELFINHGIRVQAFDPVASDSFIQQTPSLWVESGQLIVCDDQYHALKNADALVLLTEWEQFRQLDVEKLKSYMKKPLIFDGRNQFDLDYLIQNGIDYFGIGRGKHLVASKTHSKVIETT